MKQRHPPSNDALVRSSGQASARHAGIKHPADEEVLEEKLDSADLDSLGSTVEDAMRDRHSKGVAGAYDDSSAHDSDERYRDRDIPNEDG
jgi:hypothetical protein